MTRQRTSKEAADAAIAADHAYTECLFQHLRDYGRKTKDPARDVVRRPMGRVGSSGRSCLQLCIRLSQLGV